MKKYRYAFLATTTALALAFAVGACVHDGDDNGAPDTSGDMMEPVAVDMDGVDTDAMAAEGTYEIAAGEMHTAGDVTFSCAAGGDACSVMVAADGSATSTGGMVMAATSQAFMDAAQIADLQRQINALRTQLGIGPDDDPSASIAQLQRDLTALQKQASDAQDAKDKADAEAKAKADAASAGRLHTALNGTLLDLSGASAVSVSHGMPPKLTNGTISTSLKAADMTDSGMASGWSTSMYEAADAKSKMTDVVVLYTNIDPAGKEPLIQGADGMGRYADVAAVNSALAATENAELIASSHFPTGPGIRTHELDDRNGVSLAGTFAGASGTYTCTASSGGSCTSAAAAGGGIALGGEGTPTWAFVPAKNAMVDKPDGDYQSFGWWLRKDEGADPMTYSVGTFATSVDSETVTISDQLVGEAKYTGPAVGKYAMKPVLGDPSGGHFTAMASLTATFGTADTIEGAIDGFMTDAGAMDDWEVALSGNIGTTGAITATTDDPIIWTIGADDETGSPGDDDTWSGQMGALNDELLPTAVVGTFQASYGEIADMVGTFGAEN